MEDESMQSYRGTLRRAPTLRDIALVCFRNWQLILLTFGVIFLGSLVYIVITPRTYQAETKILVKRERADPVVTPENNASPILTTGVTEEDLNSEVELLGSRDRTRESGDHVRPGPSSSIFRRGIRTSHGG